jgi:hypothetical protein
VVAEEVRAVRILTDDEKSMKQEVAKEFGVGSGVGWEAEARQERPLHYFEETE